MNLFIVYFLAVAARCVQSLPAAIAELPCVKPNNSTSSDIIANGIPPAQIAVTINGNVTIQVHNSRQTCCNQQNNNMETSTPPKLPDGYLITSETDEYITAHKFHPIKETWNAARKTCFHEGGFLAYATSKEEEDLYLKMMDDKKLNDLWIGVHDFFGEGDFSTILGEVAKEAAYYTWLSGEPNNAGAEMCTHYRRKKGTTGLNDVACRVKYAFNCKIKLRKNCAVTFL